MFSEPAVGEKFFGREEILELLNKRASALKDGYRQNVALTGQSLAGKSSIILHFLRTIREEGFVPVYVEVVNEPFGAFANKFIATLLYNGLARHGERLDISLPGLLQKARETLPRTNQAIAHVLRLIDDGKIDDAYAALLALTSVLREETGTPCIVILDEFDNLERLGIRNPYLAFGKVIMVQKDTMYIVSSSRNDAIRKIISEKLSLLFGNFEVIKVSNFGAKVSCRFLDIKLAGFEIDDFVRKFLIAFTDGNPFYLDRLSAAIREAATERMTNYIGTDIAAQAIIASVYTSDGPIHRYLMNYLLDLIDSRYKDFYTGVLAAIASGHTRTPAIAKALKATQGEVAKAVDYLLERALISKKGAFLRIEDLLFEFWLTFVYRRRREMLVDGTIDRAELFRGDIDAYIKTFEREYALGAPERLAQLFSCFSNDMIELEMKNTRLPHFTKVELIDAGDGRRIIAASFRGTYWIAEPFAETVNENDIVRFIRTAKTLGFKISNKIIMPLKGLDENAKLLAKELKISIWDSPTVNMLLSLYGKKRIIIP